MAQIEILSERQSQRGWEFHAQVLDDAGQLRQHRLMLSWADYNLWSADGGDEPGKVAEAVLAFLLAHGQAESLAERFDASIARRKFPDADREIPRMISR